MSIFRRLWCWLGMHDWETVDRYWGKFSDRVCRHCGIRRAWNWRQRQ